MFQVTIQHRLSSSSTFISVHRTIKAKDHAKHTKTATAMMQCDQNYRPVFKSNQIKSNVLMQNGQLAINIAKIKTV